MAVTLQTIADEVGAAISTVSMALSDHPRVNEQTKRQIREVSLRLGYCTEADLDAKRRGSDRRKRTLRLQFLALQPMSPVELREQALSHLIHNPVQDGLRIELASTGDATPEGLRQHLVATGEEVDGLLLVGAPTCAHLAVLEARDVPGVIIGPLSDGPPPPIASCRQGAVGLDEIGAARTATERLLALGHRRIALITAHSHKGLYFDRWEDGYRTALARAGIPCDEALIHYEGVATPVLLHRLAAAPTAFVCTSASQVQAINEAAESPRARPQNTIVSSTGDELRRWRRDSFPAIVVHVDLLMAACLRRLENLVRGAPGPFETSWLPHEYRQWSSLTPPA